MWVSPWECVLRICPWHVLVQSKNVSNMSWTHVNKHSLLHHCQHVNISGLGEVSVFDARNWVFFTRCLYGLLRCACWDLTHCLHFGLLCWGGHQHRQPHHFRVCVCVDVGVSLCVSLCVEANDCVFVLLFVIVCRCVCVGICEQLVCVCMYIYIYIYIYLCMCLYRYVCVCFRLSGCVLAYSCLHVSVYVCMCKSNYLYKHTCVKRSVSKRVCVCKVRSVWIKGVCV